MTLVVSSINKILLSDFEEKVKRGVGLEASSPPLPERTGARSHERASDPSTDRSDERKSDRDGTVTRLDQSDSGGLDNLG